MEATGLKVWIERCFGDDSPKSQVGFWSVLLKGRKRWVVFRDEPGAIVPPELRRQWLPSP